MAPTGLLMLSMSAAMSALGASMAAASPTSVAADCRRVSVESRETGASERLFAMDDPSGSVEASPPVWQRRGRALMGVVARRERGRYRLRVCTVAARELNGSTARTVRQTGTTATLRKGARPVNAFVANDWLAWVEAPRSGRFRIHRQTLLGRKRASRSFRGRPRAIAMTRNGTVALTTLSGSTQHVWRWPTTGPTGTLATPRTVALRRSGEPKDPTGLQLWDPDSFLLTPPAPPTGDASLLTDPARVKTEPGGAACSVWKGQLDPGDSPARTTRLGAARLTATLTNTNTWSLRGRFDGEDWYSSRPSLTRLEACDPSTGARVLAVDAGYDTDDSSTDYDNISSVAIVGDGIFATGRAASGDTGSGSTSSEFDVAYVRDPADPRAWTTSSQHVATRAAAAWVAAGRIWASDGAGVRPIAETPEDFKGLRLRDGNPVLSIVAASGTVDVPLAAVDPKTAVLPAGVTASPFAARLPDGTPGAANFGVCSDQFAKYCPDPTVPTPGAP